MLELGENLFDGVQVGRIFRQEDQLCAGCTDEPADGFTLVATEIIHDHDVTGTQRRDENLFDIGLKPFAVDRAVDKPWGIVGA
jgi:hypothetical protein